MKTILNILIFFVAVGTNLSYADSQNSPSILNALSSDMANRISFDQRANIRGEVFVGSNRKSKARKICRNYTSCSITSRCSFTVASYKYWQFGSYGKRRKTATKSY